jgi:hypothetical protein
MPLSLKKKPPKCKEAIPSVRERTFAQRREGKKLERFMAVWIRECRVIDEYHAMIESLYGEGTKPRKKFEVTTVILETIDELFGE